MTLPVLGVNHVGKMHMWTLQQVSQSSKNLTIENLGRSCLCPSGYVTSPETANDFLATCNKCEPKTSTSTDASGNEVS